MKKAFTDFVLYAFLLNIDKRSQEFSQNFLKFDRNYNWI